MTRQRVSFFLSGGFHSFVHGAGFCWVGRPECRLEGAKVNVRQDPELLELGIREAQVVVWHRCWVMISAREAVASRCVHLRGSWVSDYSLSSPPILSFLYSTTNLPFSSLRYELFRSLYVELAQFMYRSEVKMRTDILGEPARHIGPSSKAKYVRYILFVAVLFLTTYFLLLGATKSPRPSTLERVLGD